MKKAKIMLTAIAVFAVVGGALAFKADKAAYGVTIYTGANSSDCTHELVNATTTVAGVGSQTFATFVSGAQCQLTYTIRRD